MLCHLVRCIASGVDRSDGVRHNACAFRFAAAHHRWRGGAGRQLVMTALCLLCLLQDCNAKKLSSSRDCKFGS
jgi:hypothetical protein